MADQVVKLRNIHGPLAGQLVDYSLSAAQNAVATGFAEYPTDAELSPPAPQVRKVGTPLPDDFPGRHALEAAGLSTIEQLPRDFDGLTAVDGIGEKTAERILEVLEG